MNSVLLAQNSKSSLKKIKLKKFKIRKVFKFFFKLKKKISIVYTILNLNHKSLFYGLRRRLLHLYFKTFSVGPLLKLKKKLKKIALMNAGLLVTSTDELGAPKAANVSARESSKIFLSITVHSNNIFINLGSQKKKKRKTVKFWSAGMFDFDCSKAKLKFAVATMLKEIKLKLKNLKIYVITVKAPKHLNKYLFRQLTRLMYKPRFYVYSSFKIYNGCRCKKKRRKKRLRFRFFR